jgi:hypothetical protein
MFRRYLIVLFVVAACLPEAALAQINPFRGSRGTPLSSDDIAGLTEATNRLLDQPNLATGATENWNNAQSGANGTVSAGPAVRRHGLACRVVNYKITMPGGQPDRTRTLTWCKTKNAWKIG